MFEARRLGFAPAHERLRANPTFLKCNPERSVRLRSIPQKPE
jgi:hypothetical protein